MPEPLSITGLGILTSTARGATAFEEALRSGRTRFGYLKRPGRKGPSTFIGAEIEDAAIATAVPGKAGILRAASFSAQVAVDAVAQAWTDAGLDSRGVPPERIGVVVGGTNFQVRYQQQTWHRYASNARVIRPTYALSFWDTGVIGLVAECFGIQGDSYCVGGASAGGAMALIHAARQLHSCVVDVCIAIGPLFDISFWECQALTNLGAMGGATFPDQPSLACRPFDEGHDGFIFGEGCAALVLERANGQRASYGRLLGWGQAHDGTNGPEPDANGQQRAIRAALAMAGLEASQIDYVNPHGTGAPLGDRTELETLRSVGLGHCWINATKSLVGHCLTAAGAVEAAAALLQLRGGYLHPNRNLEQPIDASFRWTPDHSVEADLRYAVSNSFAFGGLSTALVLAKEPL